MDNPNEGGQYGSTGQANNVASKKLQQTHAQVNEVVDIMRDNVEKVIDRDVKLSELDDRADALQQGASQFETQAAKLKRKYWWKNMKMWILLGVVCVIVVGVFFLNRQTPGNYQPEYANNYVPMPNPSLQNEQVVANGQVETVSATNPGLNLQQSANGGVMPNNQVQDQGTLESSGPEMANMETSASGTNPENAGAAAAPAPVVGGPASAPAAGTGQISISNQPQALTMNKYDVKPRNYPILSRMNSLRDNYGNAAYVNSGRNSYYHDYGYNDQMENLMRQAKNQRLYKYYTRP